MYTGLFQLLLMHDLYAMIMSFLIRVNIAITSIQSTDKTSWKLPFGNWFFQFLFHICCCLQLDKAFLMLDLWCWSHSFITWACSVDTAEGHSNGSRRACPQWAAHWCLQAQDASRMPSVPSMARGCPSCRGRHVNLKQPWVLLLWLSRQSIWMGQDAFWPVSKSACHGKHCTGRTICIWVWSWQSLDFLLSPMGSTLVKHNLWGCCNLIPFPILTFLFISVMPLLKCNSFWSYLPLCRENELPKGRPFPVCAISFSFSITSKFISFSVLPFYKVWAAGLLHQFFRNIQYSWTMGAFFQTKGSGLLLSHRVNQDCQETVGIVAVRNQANLLSLLPPEHFHVRNLINFMPSKPLHNGICTWEKDLLQGHLL